MIDLHIHSKYSDGSDNIEDLIDNINSAGIKCFALTDHDTAEGCRKILSDDNLKTKLNKYGIEFIVGTEWTCTYNGLRMHILAYDFDPFNESVIALENQMRDMLNAKDLYRMKELEILGYKFSEKSKEYLSSKENVRTLDFANCLVNDGYFDDVQIAANYLTKTIKYPGTCKFDAKILLENMKKLGAKLVWAHSIFDIRREVISFEEVERIIKELKPYGLVGLECGYSLYNQEQIERLLNISKKNDLFVTHGSDYHGKNKVVKLAQFSSDNSISKLNRDSFYEIFNKIYKF